MASGFPQFSARNAGDGIMPLPDRGAFNNIGGLGRTGYSHVGGNILPHLNPTSIVANMDATQERKVNHPLIYNAASQVKSIYDVKGHANLDGDRLMGHMRMGHFTFCGRRPNDAQGVVVPTSLPALNIALREAGNPLNDITVTNARQVLRTWVPIGCAQALTLARNDPSRTQALSANSFTYMSHGRVYNIPNYWLGAQDDDSQYMCNHIGAHLWLKLIKVKGTRKFDTMRREDVFQTKPRKFMDVPNDPAKPVEYPVPMEAPKTRDPAEALVWQFVPFITNSAKAPDSFELTVNDGQRAYIGTAFQVGKLARPLQGIESRNSSYLRDGRVVAGLDDDAYFDVAENRLPKAEVLLCTTK